MKNDNFIRFMQVYCAYLLENDGNVSNENFSSMKEEAIKFFKGTAIYTCMQCGHRSGLSFVENKHDCKRPMFDKEGIPIHEGVIYQCKLRALDFDKIKKSVKIKEKQK